MSRQRTVAIGVVAAAWLFGAARVAAQQPAVLSLEQAIARAQEHGEQPRIEAQRARAAEARVDKARSFFYPDVTATGSYTFRPDPASRPLPTGGSLQQDRHVFTGVVGLNLNLLEPRAFPLYSQAKLEGAAAELRAQEARRAIAFDVAGAYLAALGVEQVLRAAEQRVWLAQRILDGAQGRVEAGLSSSNDVTRSQLELASAQRELARSRGDVESARFELGYLIGTPVRDALVEPAAVLAVAPGTSADAAALSREARARRKDLAAADKQADALDAAADEPRMRWFPSLALVGQYRASTEEFFGQNDEITAGVQLSWLLWDGGERSADRDERVALAAVSDLEAQALTRRMGTDVRQALSQLERGQAEAREADAAAVAARKNMEETRELYRQGLLQSLAVADAALQLFSAEVELVRARYGIGTALLDLRAVLGLDPFGKEPR